ncbi:MAG: FkbM family methyltransferase [Syntrophaceae bacterium]|nr:FkbM family methyltransferase [Syntrophaceae bacterium]
MTAPFAHDYNLRSLRKIRVKGHDFNLYVTPRFVSPYADQEYEAVTALIIRRRAKTARTFIDVGAHYGFFSVLVGHANPDCAIFAFEPIPVNYEILEKNIALNGIRNVRLFQSAVSNRDGNAAFQVSAASDNSGFLANPAADILQDMTVSVISLDHLIEEIPNKPTLIKIDTEGSERQVLQGMKKLVKKVDELEMILEFNQRCLRHNGLMPEALLRHIHELGFSILFVHDERGFCERYEDGADWHALMGGKNYKNLYCVKKGVLKQKGLDPGIPMLRCKDDIGRTGKASLEGNSSHGKYRNENERKVRRVLFVNHSLAPYELTGTPLTTLNHARGMKAKGLEVGVLIPDPSVRQDSGKCEIDGITLYRIPKTDQEDSFFPNASAEDSLRHQQIVRHVLQDFRPDIVHINDYLFMPLETIRCFARSGVPVVRNICNTEEICYRMEPILSSGRRVKTCTGPGDMGRCAECYCRFRRIDLADALGSIKKRFAERSEYLKGIYDREVSAVVFTTPEFKRYFTSFVPIPEERIRVIPRGFSFPHARPSHPIRVEGGVVKFGFIGTGIPRKGIDVILRALELLPGSKDFEFHFFGEIGHEPFVNWIAELSKAHGNRIFCHGGFKPENLPRIVSQIHCAVIPSYFETYNRVVREVLWSGVPVIATDFFGSSIIENGRNGYRIACGDSDALAERMTEIIAFPDAIEALSRGALQTPVPSLDGEIEGLLHVYQELLSNRRETSLSDRPQQDEISGGMINECPDIDDVRPFQFATLYIDTGQGFNEEESLKRLLPGRFDKGPVTVEFNLNGFGRIRALRLDPIDNAPAGVEVIRIALTRKDGERVEIPLKGSNAADVRDNRHLFTTRDPAFYLSLPDHWDTVRSIQAVLKYSVGPEYVGMLEQSVEALKQHASSPPPHAKLYIDRGDGFSESSALIMPLPPGSDSGSVALTFPLRGVAPIRALRFDPVENAAAIIEIGRIELQAGSLVKPVRIKKSNAEYVNGNRYIFLTDDPSFHLDVPSGMAHADSLVLELAYRIRDAYAKAIGDVVAKNGAAGFMKDPSGRRYVGKIYVDNGAGFIEGDALVYELPTDPQTGRIGIDIDLRPFGKIRALRWDPIEHAAPIVELNQLQVYREGEPVRATLSGTNAKSVCDNILIFASDDPHLEIALPTDLPSADRLQIEYRVLVRNN